MSDPNRWIHDPSELTPSERRLIRRAAAKPAAPSEARDQVWAATMAGLGLDPEIEPPGPASHPGSSAATGDAAGSGGALGPLAKGTLIVTVGLLGLGLSSLGSSDPSQQRAELVRRENTQVVAKRAVARPVKPEELPLETATRKSGDQPASFGQSPPAAGKSAPDKPKAETRASRLLEEARLLSSARAALRQDAPDLALERLDRAKREFPRGALTQEREALRVEALAKTQPGGAADAARAFRQRFPKSPHAGRVESFAK